MRTPFLEHIPLDVLQHIALLSVPLAPSSKPLKDLSCLLVTSRALYNTLNICSNPHLYAAIYKLKYNPAAASLVTASALALELVHRCRALRRVRRLDMSFSGLRQDLWTLLCIVVEEGCHDYLSEAGFSNFIIKLSQHYLRQDVCSRNEIKSMVIWLLCLGLMRQDILAQPPEVWGALVALLRPFVSTSTPSFTSPAEVLHPPRHTIPWPVSWPVFRVGMSHMAPLDFEDGEIFRYNMRMRAPNLPAPSDAAIIVIFALKEAVCLQIPAHLPATRAIAVAENRSGPTAEDYAVFRSSATHLFADIRAALPVFNALKLDPWISDVINSVPPAIFADLPQRGPASYTPGALTGVWEGSLMVSTCVSLANAEAAPLSLQTPPDFLCRAPIQCQFSEYFCFSPCVPLPTEMSALILLHETTDINKEISLKTPSGCFSYQKFGHGEEFQREFSRPVLDHVLIGQTLRTHEDAWNPGGFNFTGRVHDNGLVSFIRRPKNDESEPIETWVFEGRLRYGMALVGTFRSSLAVDTLSGVQGIFSMRKVE